MCKTRLKHILPGGRRSPPPDPPRRAHLVSQLSRKGHRRPSSPSDPRDTPHRGGANFDTGIPTDEYALVKVSDVKNVFLVGAVDRLARGGQAANHQVSAGTGESTKGKKENREREKRKREQIIEKREKRKKDKK